MCYGTWELNSICIDRGYDRFKDAFGIHSVLADFFHLAFADFLSLNIFVAPSGQAVFEHFLSSSVPFFS